MSVLASHNKFGIMSLEMCQNELADVTDKESPRHHSDSWGAAEYYCLYDNSWQKPIMPEMTEANLISLAESSYRNSDLLCALLAQHGKNGEAATILKDRFLELALHPSGQRLASQIFAEATAAQKKSIMDAILSKPHALCTLCSTSRGVSFMMQLLVNSEGSPQEHNMISQYVCDHFDSILKSSRATRLLNLYARRGELPGSTLVRDVIIHKIRLCFEYQNTFLLAQIINSLPLRKQQHCISRIIRISDIHVLLQEPSTHTALFDVLAAGDLHGTTEVLRRGYNAELAKAVKRARMRKS